MAKTVTAIKNILGREEKLLAKLQETLPIIVHKETKASIREMVKTKKADIRSYKKILKASEKCPAIKKPAGKKSPAKMSSCKTGAKASKKCK